MYITEEGKLNQTEATVIKSTKISKGTKKGVLIMHEVMDIKVTF